MTDFNFTEGGYVPSSNFNFVSPFFTYSILAGVTNEFVAIWADPDASLTSGKFYAATADAMSVVNTADNSLYDAYSKNLPGRANEVLTSNDIVDINVAP